MEKIEAWVSDCLTSVRANVDESSNHSQISSTLMHLVVRDVLPLFPMLSLIPTVLQ